MLDKAGVYTITCLPTGKVYVGSTSRSFARRFASHRHALKARRGYCPKLMNAWEKYGEQSFVFSPIVVCDPSNVLMYEQLVLDLYRPELNVLPTAGSCAGLIYDATRRDNCRKNAVKQWSNGVFDSRPPAIAPKKHFVRGEMLTVQEMSSKYNVSTKTIRARLTRYGFSGDSLVIERSRGQR